MKTAGCPGKNSDVADIVNYLKAVDQFIVKPSALSTCMKLCGNRVAVASNVHSLDQENITCTRSWRTEGLSTPGVVLSSVATWTASTSSLRMARTLKSGPVTRTSWRAV